MTLSHYMFCLWPGLPELWFRGRWVGLPAAIAFAIVLNVLLVARFIYPQWLEPLFVRLVFWAFVAIWAVVFIRAVRSLPLMLSPREALGAEDLFDTARSEYLKGRWFESEALLTQCLETESRDAPALLLLASVYRQTGRFAAAEQTLGALAVLEAGDGWWLEREIEERRLQQAKDELSEDESSADTDDRRAGGDEHSETETTTKASSSTVNSATEGNAADLAGSLQFAGSDDKQG